MENGGPVPSRNVFYSERRDEGESRLRGMHAGDAAHEKPHLVTNQG